MLLENEKKNIVSRLRRIEGQLRGIQQMVEDERYCIDILTQLRSADAAVAKVEDIIMRSHLHTCVTTAIRSGEQIEADKKIDEVMTTFEMYRR